MEFQTLLCTPRVDVPRLYCAQQHGYLRRDQKKSGEMAAIGRQKKIRLPFRLATFFWRLLFNNAACVMPTYNKSTSSATTSLEKSAENEARSVTQTAENTVQELVDENGESGRQRRET